jgi:catechol 2,3-dioxygenase-like lactoylglutathione lyase family enzyme
VTVEAVANLAIKVSDLESACAFYERAGGVVTNKIQWEGSLRADVALGALSLTLFTRAIYEDIIDLPDEGFLHPALFTDDLDQELEGHDVVFGPVVVSGPFGTRRIAFVAAPGGMRLEFMEQITQARDEPEENSV